jgi:hypothetical protein
MYNSYSVGELMEVVSTAKNELYDFARKTQQRYNTKSLWMMMGNLNISLTCTTYLLSGASGGRAFSGLVLSTLSWLCQPKCSCQSKFG